MTDVTSYIDSVRSPVSSDIRSGRAKSVRLRWRNRAITACERAPFVQTAEGNHAREYLNAVPLVTRPLDARTKMPQKNDYLQCLEQSLSGV